MEPLEPIHRETDPDQVPNPFHSEVRLTPAGERELISSALLAILAENEHEYAKKVATALIHAATLEDERCVPAAKVILDRMEGPVERRLKHTFEAQNVKQLVIDPDLLPEKVLIERARAHIDAQFEKHNQKHANGSNGNGHSSNGNGKH